MKKFFMQATALGVACLTMVQFSIAQAPKAPVAPVAPKEEKNENENHTEVVIRQNGDKDTKIILEIKDGNFFLNGKPLEKFDDQNIVVEKREINEDIDIDPQVMMLPYMRDRSEELSRQKIMRDDMQRRMEKNIQIRMNSAFLGVSSKRAEKGGCTVLEITKGSPAEKAGLKAGDLITKVNTKPVDSPEGLFDVVHEYKPGDKITIGYSRNGKPMTTSAVLDKPAYSEKHYNYNYNFKVPPIPPMAPMDGMNGFWEDHAPKIGIRAQDTEDGKGVNVLEVEDSSAAAKAGLKKGDIILQFNGADVNSTNELLDRLHDARQQNTVKAKIQRGSATQEVDLKIPRKLKTAGTLGQEMNSWQLPAIFYLRGPDPSGSHAKRKEPAKSWPFFALLFSAGSQIPDMQAEVYETVIGLEVHAQLLTKTKLFCSDETSFGAEPNTHISPVTLGYPGTLPVLNIEAVFLAAKMGIACYCEIEKRNYFARKNYFYPDLPKGYQISQPLRRLQGRMYRLFLQPKAKRKFSSTGFIWKKMLEKVSMTRTMTLPVWISTVPVCR